MFDKNKFKNILAIIDKNTFNYRHKRGEFKYVDIADLVINIKNNKISEIFTTKILNTLNKIKNAEIIKLKKRTPRQKELLNLLNNLSDTILTDKTLESKSQEEEEENENKNENENDNKNKNDKNENENDKNENKNDKILRLSKD